MLQTLLSTLSLAGLGTLIGASSFATAATEPGAQVPTADAVPAAIRTADITASIEISATHFLAQSRVNELQWLVFSNAERGLIRVRQLPPHESALLPIPTGGKEGMSVELVARAATGALLTSRMYDCEELTGDSVFLERQTNTILGWIPRHGGRSLTQSNTSGTATSLAARPATAHVPVPLPSENRKKSKARKIPAKKLPPI